MPILINARWRAQAILGLAVWLAACTATGQTTPPSATLDPGATAPATADAAPATVQSPSPTATPTGLAIYLPLIHGPEATPPPTGAPEIVAAPPASPTPDWPAPRANLTSSKLGLHTLGPTDPYIMEFVRRARPRVVKSVGDFGWLTEVKQASPETIIIGRHLDQEEHWVLTTDPAAAGVVFVEQHLEAYRLNPQVDYWEGWNELGPGTPERMTWFALFEASRACAMQQHGFRAAVGGFSTGVPEYDLMDEFLPALEAAQRCGGIFHLHEYASPTFQCGVAVNVPGLIPGAPPLSVPAGPLSLRYRIWYEGLLKPRGLGSLPLVISELGIDGLAPSPACDDPGYPGWKLYSDWWVQRGYGPSGPQAYVNVLGWYDNEMRSDPYVLGAAIFTTGALEPQQQWHAFELHDALIPLAHYLVSQP